MTPEDLDTAIAWAAREGWNPGLSDARAFLAQDPGGFLMNEVEGRMAACISVVRYGDAFGFLGFYIAEPASRGQGHGMALWRAGMARLAGRTVGLDGVVAQQENYRRSGFALAWNNARYEAVAPRLPPPDAALRPAAALPFETLLALDTACFGVPRPAFLRAWLDTPEHVALALPGGDGYGVVRPARAGWKVGPLFAPDAAGARRLLAGLAAAAGPGPLVLDVPEDHAAAVALAHEAGMAKVFETARMYAGPAPAMRREAVFGVTSFELG
jgi:hypothetical protein